MDTQREKHKLNPLKQTKAGDLDGLQTEKAGISKLNSSQSVVLGLMLFGLFFGAGNTIFPVRMGLAAGPDYIPATIGFLLTGIGLPLLGVVSFSLSQKNRLLDYAGIAGQTFGLAYTLLLYLTIGPLFAIPRTATVAFELGFSTLPDEKAPLALFLFSLIFFALAVYLALKPNRLMDIVGRYLTPLFLILLGILLVTVFIKTVEPAGTAPIQKPFTGAPFLGGFISGYETMDALASLAFASLIVSNLKSLGIQHPGRRATETLKSGMVMVVTMSVIYSALSYLGASSASLVTDPAANGGQILALVSHHYFGLPGQILLAAIITVACLKTALGLIVSLGDMFGELFPHSKFMTYERWAILFALISFGIANFGLDTILTISKPVLIFLYPLTIVLIFFHLINKPLPLKPSAFGLTLLLTGLASLPEALNNLPALQNASSFQALLSGLKSYLPLFKQGFGWLIPAGLGLLISLLCLRRQPQQHSTSAKH